MSVISRGESFGVNNQCRVDLHLPMHYSPIFIMQTLPSLFMSTSSYRNFLYHFWSPRVRSGVTNKLCI